MNENNFITRLNINDIVPNKYQPRKVFPERELESLANSIKEYGILNPILVRKKDDKYEIIAGERRFRAAKLCGLSEIPTIIKNTTEQELAELALIENIQRQELSSIEEAKSYEEIMRIGNQTQESLAKKIGKSQASIANKLRLLSLPDEVQKAIALKQIGERHARCLLSLKTPEKQIEIMNKIINEKLTVRDTEKIVQKEKESSSELDIVIEDIRQNEHKEEKEEDNMNNGSFFPSYNNNINNNQASLNSMNMQSMGDTLQPQMNNEQFSNTMPQDVQMNQPNYNMTNTEQVIQPQQGVYFQGQTQPFNNVLENNMNQQPESKNVLQNNETQNIIPFNSANINMDNGSQTFNQNSMEQPIVPNENSLENIIDINQPTFEIPIVDTLNQINSPAPQMYEQPMMPDIPVNTIEQNVSMNNEINTQSMIDTPLFDANAIMPNEIINSNVSPSQNINQGIFTSTNNLNNDTPTEMFNQQVETQPVIDVSTQPIDKTQQLIQFLNEFGYQYKLFSNDTTNCLIIEVLK